MVADAKGKEPATKISNPCFISFKTILTRHVIIVRFSSTAPADQTARGRHVLYRITQCLLSQVLAANLKASH